MSDDISSVETELMPIRAANLLFTFKGISPAKRETYIAKLPPNDKQQLFLYKWLDDPDKWDLLLAFSHPDELHVTILAEKQPLATVEQRVLTLLASHITHSRCPYCQRHADDNCGMRYHLGRAMFSGK